MAAPHFYISPIDPASKQLELQEPTSRHITQVLRMQPGEEIRLADGRGNLYRAKIQKADRRKTIVDLLESVFQSAPPRQISIGISLIKNLTRFEWFLEKATEIGVSEIIPILCARTEKQRFRPDRMQSILISAMLQSQRSWLPDIREPMRFVDLLALGGYQQKFIVHCIDANQANLSDLTNSNLHTQIVLIGPEGDFTKEEIDLALHHKYLPVSLGTARLRSETAGIVALTILNIS